MRNLIHLCITGTSHSDFPVMIRTFNPSFLLLRAMSTWMCSGADEEWRQNALTRSMIPTSADSSTAKQTSTTRTLSLSLKPNSNTISWARTKTTALGGLASARVKKNTRVSTNARIRPKQRSYPNPTAGWRPSLLPSLNFCVPMFHYGSNPSSRYVRLRLTPQLTHWNMRGFSSGKWAANIGNVSPIASSTFLYGCGRSYWFGWDCV